MLKTRCHHGSTSQTMSGQLPVLTWQLVPSRSHTCYLHLQRWDQFIIPNQKHSKTSHLHANHGNKKTTMIMIQIHSTAYIANIDQTTTNFAGLHQQPCIDIMRFQKSCRNLLCPRSSAIILNRHTRKCMKMQRHTSTFPKSLSSSASGVNRCTCTAHSVACHVKLHVNQHKWKQK